MEEQRNIERYLDGKMSAEEKKVLEDRLAVDQAFSEALKLEEVARASIRAAGRADLRDKMLGWEEEWEKEPYKAARVRPEIFRLGAVAAAILFLIAIGWWLTREEPSSITNLHANYYKPYEPPSRLRGAAYNSEWEEAINAYTQQQYKRAATAFSNIPVEQAPKYLSCFYGAISYLALDPPEASKALSLLDQVLTVDNDYQRPARWYRSLALLNLGQVVEAKAELRLLLQNGGYRKAEIEELLEDLD